jgi:hypothetical protein
MNGILPWLHAQANALFATISDVASNRPEPARQVVIYTVVLAALLYAIPKIIKLVSK